MQQELAAKVKITEADIAAYYREHAAERSIAGAPDEEATAAQVDQMIIQQLRRQKTEEAYGPWIEQIRTRYPVTIDQAVVKRLVSSDSGIGVEEGVQEER